MKKAYLKSILREIKSTPGQFLAIFAIVALGVGFFAGLNGATPDMKATADAYFKAGNLADFRLISTMGFTQDDVKSLAELDEIESIEAGYAIDAIVDRGDKAVAARVMSVPQDGGLSRPVLVEGRLPQNKGECVIDAMSLRGREFDFAAVGETLTLAPENSEDTLDLFNEREFKIVGAVDTPAYISFQRGTTNILNGELRCFIMVLPDAFSSEYYLELKAAVKGAQNLNGYSDAYDELIEDTTDRLEAFANDREAARFGQIKSDAQKELDEKRSELNDAGADYQNALKDYDDQKAKADKEIADAQAEISDGQAALNDAYDEIAAAQRELENGEDEYQAQLSALNRRLAEPNAQIAALRQQAQAAEQSGMAAQAAYFNAQADAAQQQLDQNPEIADANARLAEARRTLDAGYDELEDARRQAQNGEDELAQSRADLDEAKRQADKQFADADKELADAKAKIEDAKQKLDDAQKELDDLESPEWYILPRAANPGYAGFGSDADRIAAISRVFPFFFFLVAALVCLTTMTRMVEDQRTQIGLLKALGYNNASVISKYMFYAAAAGVSGSVVGLIVGLNVFPRVIWQAYGMMYNLPPIILSFHPGIAFLSSGAAIGSILTAAGAAAAGELKESAAGLLRPKAPASGKRVFLEKIPAVWKRMKFMQKVSARNLFRYKKRFFMTVLGICGCTMLMLTAFGLKDSISHIVSSQYGGISKYDAVLTLAEPDGTRDGLDEWLNQNNVQALYAMQSSVTLEYGGASETSYLLVPKDPSRLTGFIELQDRLTGEKVAAPNSDGVVITEKIAGKLGIVPGDTITIRQGDTKSVPAKISGVTENYVYHYVYMTPDMYARLFGEAPEYREAMLITGITDLDAHEDFIEQALKQDGVAGAVSQAKIAADYDDMMDSLNSVVLVLLFCANLLAVIVLYNLAVINITERTREIATIKVLGFTGREAAAYVFRENIILTAIGVAAGLFFGVLLHRFVIVTAEVDMVMFQRKITPQSFFYAGALTFAFAFAINALMRLKLRAINPVESLKSAE